MTSKDLAIGEVYRISFENPGMNEGQPFHVLGQFRRGDSTQAEFLTLASDRIAPAVGNDIYFPTTFKLPLREIDGSPQDVVHVVPEELACYVHMPDKRPFFDHMLKGKAV